MSHILQLASVTLRFGGLTAVQDLSFEVESGNVIGLIGPNGAGKSTVFNLITGLYAPSSGRITFGGQSIAGKSVSHIARCGIARTFQNIRLFAFMSARENIMVGQHTRMKAHFVDSMFHTPRHQQEERQVLADADELLRFVGLEAHAEFEAHSLSYGQQRRLEIARALAAKPTLLLLDEPAAGMNPSEKNELLELIEHIRQRGITVICIEHDMGLVMKVCSYLFVLDNGKLIAAGTPEKIRQDPQVIEAYLGGDHLNTELPSGSLAVGFQ